MELAVVLKLFVVVVVDLQLLQTGDWGLDGGFDCAVVGVLACVGGGFDALEFYVFADGADWELLELLELGLLKFFDLTSQTGNDFDLGLVLLDHFFVGVLLEGEVSVILELLNADLLPELLHRVNNIRMQFVQFLLVQVISWGLAVRTTLWKLIALMSLVQVLELLLFFLLLYFLYHLAGFLRHVAVGLLFGWLLICLALFCGEGGVLDFSCLELGFVVALALVFFLALDSIGFEHFELSDLLLPLQPCLLLIIQQLQVILQGPSHLLAHKLIPLRRKGNILFFLLRVKEPRRGLDRITVRNVLQNHSPRSRPFELRYPEQTRVVAEHLCAVSQQFGEDACFVVPWLPDLVLRAV